MLYSALDAALDLRLNSRFFQLVGDDLLHLRQKRFALFATGVDRLFYLLVSDRIEEAKAQVFQFAANLAHAEAVGDRSVNLQRLFGDLLLALGLQDAPACACCAGGRPV